MAKCLRCGDTGRVGRQLCPACNGEGLAAPLIGAVLRIKDRLTLTETVRPTAAQRRQLPANKAKKGKR